MHEISHCYTARVNARPFTRAFSNQPMSLNAQKTSCFNFYRNFCQEKHLTHIDNTGKALMVDVSEKRISFRTAKAQAFVKVGETITDLIEKNCLKKGDVLTVAQIAGIMGAKKTSELIPLCHNIPLSKVDVNIRLDKGIHSVIITATVHCHGKTGVEMEALTAATISALTVYDMCKAVSHDIVISEVLLMEKTGGKSGDFQR